MSMFQPQNYGADFIGGMSAMSNMVNDRRRLDMDEKRQAEEEKTRAIQRETATLDNQRTAQALRQEKLLQDFLTHARDWESGKITPEGIATLNKVTPELVKETPYVSDKIEDFPARRQANNILAQGVESISTLPKGNYVYTRADNLPEINQTLDAYQMNLPPERFNKEFVDKDGSVTGKPGTVYKTTGVGGFAMMSGDGRDAAFTPMFSVADAQGNPIVKADGKPLLVPATVNGSNDPNDPVRKIRPEEILTKIGFANKLMDTAEKLVGTADKRKEYVAQQAPYYMGQEGLKEIYQSSVKDNGVFERDPHKELRKKDGTLLAAAEPKEEKETDKAPTSRTVERNGFKETEEYAGAGQWKVVARNKIKEPKGEGSKDSSGTAQAKVGVLNNVKAAMLRRYVPVAQNELRRKGGKDEELEPTLDDKALGLPANPAGVYSALGETGRKVYDRAMVLAEQFASKGQNPETAVTNALAQASKEHGLDSQGRVQARQAPPPKQQAKPQQAKAPQKKQQVAKNDTRPPLSAFNKGR